MTVEQAAAGMFRVINTNMAQGVREISVRRGLDAREFPMVVAGGAGAIHACAIAAELDIPLILVPRESSIFCAAGMLMVDLKHDYVRTHVARLDAVDWVALNRLYDDMIADGDGALAREGIADDRRRFIARFDCRYAKQYHEVSFTVPLDAVRAADAAAIADAFHAEHDRLYGYSLAEQGTPVQIINLRLQALGETDKPAAEAQPHGGADPSGALKGERRMYIPEQDGFGSVPVYDGHALRHGNRIAGPALIEQVNTAIFVSQAYDCVCDRAGSFAVFRKGRDELVDGPKRKNPSPLGGEVG
jgi:N-methylhydantoinase A